MILLLSGLGLLLLGLSALVPVRQAAPAEAARQRTTDAAPALAGYPDSPPERSLRLLFVHHSVGGQLLADPGTRDPQEKLSIHRSHPNGGGLRARLEAAGYVVHEASYGSDLGRRTDLFDWLPKFRSQMAQLKSCTGQDSTSNDGCNKLIMFKSCYPNSRFQPGRGEAANAAGPDLTLANAQATFLALLEEFARHPEVLFVYLTAPPIRATPSAAPLWKHLARVLLSRPSGADEQLGAARDARAFNDWLVSPQGWLAGYRPHNVAVFDYFDVLTGDGQSNFLRYPGNGGSDDHPSSEGQQIAAARLEKFLNRAVRRAQLN